MLEYQQTVDILPFISRRNTSVSVLNQEKYGFFSILFFMRGRNFMFSEAELCMKKTSGHRFTKAQQNPGFILRPKKICVFQVT